MLALIPWWLLVEILSLLVLPLALTLFRRLPDRGYPLAKILGVLVPAFLAWFLSMWQLASFSTGLIIFGLLVVAGASAVLLWKDRTPLQWLREHWRLVVGYELFFAVVLIGGAVLRAYAPWGGPSVAHTEQPSDFALLNGILQSRSFPPQDPWLSGYSINYYYLGYQLAATLTKLSGLTAAVAFNLNLALLLALTALGCFSLGYNLTRLIAPRARLRGALVGLLAAFFALAVGNQMGAIQASARTTYVTPLTAGETLTVLRAALSGTTDPIPLGHEVRTGDFGTFDSVRPAESLQAQDGNWWWWGSRVLWDERPTFTATQQISASNQVLAALLNWRNVVSPAEIQRSYSITEFPFFSFYLGDMHPHVMSLPLTLLAMSLAVSVIVAPERGMAGLGAGRWRWFFLGLTALILGSLYVANSWDFPTYLLLYGAAWTWRWRREVKGKWSKPDTLALLRDMGILVGLCIALYLPFFLTFRNFAGGANLPQLQEVPILGTLLRLPILSRLFNIVGLVFWDKTSLYTLLVIFGLFLYPLVSWVIARAVERKAWLEFGLWVVIAAAALLAWLLHFPLLLLVPILLLGWKLLQTERPAEAMVVLVGLLAIILLLGTEVFYIRDTFESRFNTIFKFYFQVWILLAIAAAWVIGQVVSNLRRRPLALVPWMVPLLLLAAGSLVYPTMAMKQALKQQPVWSLDGLYSMQQNQPGDYAGVQWLLQNAAPNSVVLEAVGPEWFSTSGRVSSSTGLPTLLGWDGHESQWRRGQPLAFAEIYTRTEAVKTIYSTTDVAQARTLLDQYGVDYVFIGSQEAGFAPEGLAKFDRLGTMVFEEQGVRIYQINR